MPALTRKDELTYNDQYTPPKGTTCRVLAIGDPHFRIDNLEDVAVFITRLESLVCTEQPDFVVVLGDLLHCHERIHTTVLNKAYTFIHRLRQYCPVYVIVGNHDYINNSQFLTSNHWMNAMKEWDNVHVVDSGMVHRTPCGTFVFCPYVFPGKLTEALDTIDSDWSRARTVFCHQEFRGCKMGAICSTDGDTWALDQPFVVSGHIHDKQRVQANVFYPGSSLQHAFGESHDKTVTLCHFGDTIRLESIDMDLPRKKIVYMDMEDVHAFRPPPLSPNQTKLRVTLSGTYEEFKVFRKSKKYKELVGHNIKVVYRHKTDVADCAPAQVEGNSFYDILLELIQNEHNPELMELYNTLISQ